MGLKKGKGASTAARAGGGSNGRGSQPCPAIHDRSHLESTEVTL